MEEIGYCTFCGRILRNEYSYCPFCGVQCRDSIQSDGVLDRIIEKVDNLRSFGALHKLQEMESTLTHMEMELNVFLSSRNG